MAGSISNTLKVYLKPSLLVLSILIVAVLFIPYILIIDQYLELLLFQGTAELPNPIIVIIGEANILGRVLVTIGLSVLGTALASYLLIKFTETESTDEVTL